MEMSLDIWPRSHSWYRWHTQWTSLSRTHRDRVDSIDEYRIGSGFSVEALEVNENRGAVRETLANYRYLCKCSSEIEHWTMHCFCRVSQMTQSSSRTGKYVKSRWSISILIRLWSRESARTNSIWRNLICTRDWKCDYKTRSDSLWAVVCGNKSLFVCESFVMRPLWKC